MLRIFKEAGDKSSRNANYQFWQQDNQPKIIYTPEFAARKLEYIHNNHVGELVEKAEEYIYSSARDYYYGKKCGLIKIEFLI